MAHIRKGAPGKNGPSIITLTKSADGKGTVPAGSKHTDTHYPSFDARYLYVNMHSDDHKGGEIRAQVNP
jgi:hypothetical protein